MARIPVERTLSSIVQDLERRVRDLETGNPINTGATIDSGALKTADFDGTSFADPGSSGNYFGADGAVLNALYLRPGSISNDTLLTPVIPVAANASATGASVASGSYVTAATTTITVPAGFTKLAIIGVGTAFGFNTGGGAGLCHVVINGVAGNDGYGFVSGAGNAGATGTLAQVITGLSGGTVITLTCVFGGAGTGTWTSVAGTISALGNWGR